MRKKTNLQPLIDYIKMLRKYEECNYLEMAADKHEAYITQPALLTLSTFDTPKVNVDNQLDVASNIRDYAAYIAAYQLGLENYQPENVMDPEKDLVKIPKKQLMEYYFKTFALHVVKPDSPHDPMYSILLTRKRWLGLVVRDYVEVVDYQNHNSDGK